MMDTSEEYIKMCKGAREVQGDVDYENEFNLLAFVKEMQKDLWTTLDELQFGEDPCQE
tara:strand:+ start:951 stop:1124 length:174 start_codon:yes stop_codon:yes gene_type:complete